MKLRNKILLAIGTGFTVLTICTLVNANFLLNNPPVFIAITAMIALSLFGCLYFQVIKPIKQLNQAIQHFFIKHIFLNKVTKKSSNEITAIADHLQAITTTLADLPKQINNQVDERTTHLQAIIYKLEQEVINQKSIHTELVHHKEHLVRLAHYDSLTSLPNRVFFNEMFNKALTHAAFHKKMLAVLFVDLDHFKTINDTEGHPAGDTVLKETASRFSSILRSSDVIARLGGDEFIILLNDITDPQAVDNIADMLLKSTRTPIKINNHEILVTCSIGICLFPQDGLSLEDLQRKADTAMYKAKNTSGGIYQYYSENNSAVAQETNELESALVKAIQNNEFILYFQPKYTLADGIICGTEALIRWESPTYGLVSPLKFLPLAETTGLIYQIGEWSIQEACRINKMWQDLGLQLAPVAVNLSIKQFHHEDLTTWIQNALSQSGLEAKYLELEITENAISENIELALLKLQQLQNLGVRISIEDFGTGFTSFSHLENLALSTLKIDQKFIKSIQQDAKKTGIITAMINLAHNLDIRVVAEGVETPAQLQFLADNDCDMVQGYYLNRPLPEKKLRTQLLGFNGLTEKSS